MCAPALYLGVAPSSCQRSGNHCLDLPPRALPFKINRQRVRELIRKLLWLITRILVVSARPLPDDRDAIWSIPRIFQLVYFVVFIGICVPIIVNIVREELTDAPDAGWIQLARESAVEFAPAGVGAAIGSLIAVQGVALIVSLYHLITNRFTRPIIEEHEARGRKEGREEGREEGAERANQAWREWNQRRLDHEARGIPFDEPPPDQQPPGRNGREE